MWAHVLAFHGPARFGRSNSFKKKVRAARPSWAQDGVPLWSLRGYIYWAQTMCRALGQVLYVYYLI